MIIYKEAKSNERKGSKMATHIRISELNKVDNDEIFVFSKDAGYVVFVRRDDLPSLRMLGTNEHKKPGIYVLMDDFNRRYVGQASDAVISRLNDHEKRKKWWTKAVFFGRDDRGLDKSQLDYLERMLIAEHSHCGFDMDNGDSGNNSYIDFFQQLKADNLWISTQEIFNGVAKFNLFEKKKAPKSTSLTVPPSKDTSTTQVFDPQLGEQEQASTDEYEPVIIEPPLVNTTFFSLTDSLGNKIEAKSLRQTYVEWVETLYKVSEYSNQFLNMAQQGSAIFKTTEFLGPKGEKHTRKIDEQLYLFVRLNAKDTTRRIRVIAEKLGIQASIDKQ